MTDLITAEEAQKLRAERDDAQREAVELASFMARTFHPDVPQWRPLDYPAGVISQIDNMVAGLAAENAALQEQVRGLVDSGNGLYGAVRDALLWDQRRGYLIPYRVRDPLHRAMRKVEALAAVQAKEGGQ